MAPELSAYFRNLSCANPSLVVEHPRLDSKPICRSFRKPSILVRVWPNHKICHEHHLHTSPAPYLTGQPNKGRGNRWGQPCVCARVVVHFLCDTTFRVPYSGCLTRWLETSAGSLKSCGWKSCKRCTRSARPCRVSLRLIAQST